MPRGREGKGTGRCNCVLKAFWTRGNGVAFLKRLGGAVVVGVDGGGDGGGDDAIVPCLSRVILTYVVVGSYLRSQRL